MLQNLPELPPAPPPDYATVVKEKEEEEDLPSYFQVFAYATLPAQGLRHLRQGVGGSTLLLPGIC